MSKVHRPSVARDVAKLAGVSQSAVSRAFTPGASISAKTREKVLKAAKQLTYRPNIVARSLITRRSRIIGVSMTRLDQFNPHLLEVLNVRLRAHGYGTMIFVIDPTHDADLVLDDALQRQVDGFILASTRPSAAFVKECNSVGIPVILLNRYSDERTIHSVTGDDIGGSRAIARFLMEGGHKSYAFIAGQSDSSTSKRREAGYTEELGRHGVKDVMKVTGDYTWEGACIAARELLSKPDRPDAIFCASDYMALAALEVARHEFSLSIPEDLSIVGFGDVVAAAWPSYSLTTYSNPVDRLVDEIVRILIDIFSKGGQKGGKHEQAIVSGQLVVRESARIPAPARETGTGA
jgi:LacI family transcriptional regulator